jgi:hypothetical protein
MKAEIATHQAKFTLERLHAELAGKILQSEEEGERLREDMKHVEAVLKLLDPDYRVQAIAVRRRKPNPYFKRGTIFRHALEALRDAPAPMTARDIYPLACFAAIGVPEPPHDALKGITETVHSLLKNNEGKVVRAVAGVRPERWVLIT